MTRLASAFVLALLICGNASGGNSAAAADGPLSREKPAAKRRTLRTDEQRLQGTWEVVSAISDGQPSPRSVGVRYTFAAGRLAIRRPDRKPVQHRYEINTRRKPPHLDAVLMLFGAKRTQKGIYRFDGRELVWTTSGSQFPRPTDHSAKQRGYESRRLKRVAAK